jgi:hypothetical protein
MIRIVAMLVAAVVLVIAGAIVFLSDPMRGSFGWRGLCALLLGALGVSVFVAAGVVVSLKDAEERLQALLKEQREARSPPSDRALGSADR